MTDAVAVAERVCFFAHYDEHDVVADHVRHYLSALAAAGFSIVFASTSRLPEAQVAAIRPLVADVIVRENVGLDFGSWRACYERHPAIGAALLLLANDSVYGPVGDLSLFVDTVDGRPEDVCGVVASDELAPHLQSWFILLRRAAFTSDAFDRFMRQRDPAGTAKQAIIERNEVGLTGTLRAAGFSVGALYDPATAGTISATVPFNASHWLWSDLVDSGRSPFVKIELLRDNPFNIHDVAQWPQLVRRFAPALVPMIERDLARRPGRRRSAGAEPAARLDLAEARAKRELIRLDFRLSRSALHGLSRGVAAAFKVVVVSAGRLRRARCG